MVRDHHICCRTAVTQTVAQTVQGLVVQQVCIPGAQPGIAWVQADQPVVIQALLASIACNAEIIKEFDTGP